MQLVWGLRKSSMRSFLARRVSPGGGVPLVGPQEELRGPSGHTPMGFTPSPRREAKKGLSGFITTNKQTNKQEEKKE